MLYLQAVLKIDYLQNLHWSVPTYLSILLIKISQKFFNMLVQLGHFTLQKVKQSCNMRDEEFLWKTEAFD